MMMRTRRTHMSVIAMAVVLGCFLPGLLVFKLCLVECCFAQSSSSDLTSRKTTSYFQTRRRNPWHHHLLLGVAHPSTTTKIGHSRRRFGIFSKRPTPHNTALPLDDEKEEEEMSSSSFTKTSTGGDNGILLSYNASESDAGSLSMEELWLQLQSSPTQGLSQDEAERRLQVYGPNVLAQPTSKSLWKLVLEQFDDRLVQILLAVALLSSVFSFAEVYQAATAAATTGETGVVWWKSFVEPAVILAILVLNAIVGVIQSQSAADSLQALRDMQSGTATVLRDNAMQCIASSDLVPGDVIQVRVGDKIPADARLVSTQGAIANNALQLDEGSLTGESVTVAKLPGNLGTTATPQAPIQDQKGLLFGGTMVTAGTGLALVVQTGMDTQFGKIQQGVTAAQAETVKTPLAARLDEFGNQLTGIIAGICVLVWIVSIPKMQDSSFDGNIWEGALYYAKVAVALGVAAIPEGLPAVITLCLSLGTRKMAERNVIVRKLPSVETLGCTTVICTDKTGTLTMNEMTAVSLVLLEEEEGKEKKNPNNDDSKKHRRLLSRSEDDDLVLVEHVIQGSSYSPLGEIDGILKNEEILSNPKGALADVAAVSALCNDAKIVGNDIQTTNNNNNNKDEHESNKKATKTTRIEKREKSFERIGEPTEAALCVLAEKIGGLSSSSSSSYDDDTMLTGVLSIQQEQQQSASQLASANVDLWRERRPRLATLEFSRDRKSMSVLCQFPRSMDLEQSIQQVIPEGVLVPYTNKNKNDGESPRPHKKQQQQRRRKRRKTKHNDNSVSRLLVKGAPNLLIERCTHMKQRDGSVVKLTGALRRRVEAKVSEMAARPLRCLALAVKEHDDLEESLKTFRPPNMNTAGDDEQGEGEDENTPPHPLLSKPENFRDIESRLTLVGLVGIKDPARPEVAQSIELCSHAGIRIIMITGDARDTAVAIAKDVNIFSPDADTATLKAFEGREFFQKSAEEQLQLLEKDNLVFCRAEPADKQKLVKMLQSLNEIPAMTGDVRSVALDVGLMKIPENLDGRTNPIIVY